MVWYNVVSSKPIISTLFQPIGLIRCFSSVKQYHRHNDSSLHISFDCICGMPANQPNRAGLQQHPLVACCSSTPWRLHWRERERESMAPDNRDEGALACLVLPIRNTGKNMERFTNLRVILAQGPC